MKRKQAVIIEEAVIDTEYLTQIIQVVIRFLQVFMTETLAKRTISTILIAAGIRDEKVVAIVGLSARSIWTIRKSIERGEIEEIFVIKPKSGRPGKARDIESAIAEELEKNNYHTRQQVADMIYEKYGVSMSVSAVGKLLKKTATGG